MFDKTTSKHHWLVILDDKKLEDCLSDYIKKMDGYVLKCTDPKMLPELVSQYH